MRQVSGYTVKLRKSNKYDFIAKLWSTSTPIPISIYKQYIIWQVHLHYGQKRNEIFSINTLYLIRLRNMTHQWLWGSPASAALAVLQWCPGWSRPAASRGTPGGWSLTHAAALPSAANTLLHESNDLCRDLSHFEQTQSAAPCHSEKHHKGKYLARLWY